VLGQFCRLLGGKSVKHINPFWAKQFGCNSERIESNRYDMIVTLNKHLDATQKELKEER